MALYHPKQFAETCGCPYATVRSDIKRGKLIKSGDYIDSDIYPNNEYLKRKQAEAADRPTPEPKVELTPLPITPKRPNVKEPVYPTPETPNVKAPRVTFEELDRQKKALDIEKTAEEIRKLKITIEKLEGEVIPIDLVRSILIQQSKAATTAFKNACDNVLDEFAVKSKMSNDERSRLRGRIIAETNQAIDEAVNLAKKEANQIADEYSAKRGKGERK